MPVREEDVSQVWADVLDISDVDVDMNFFELGGTSLLLMKLASRLNEKLGIEADILMLMEYPTVESFTSHWNTEEALVSDDR